MLPSQHHKATCLAAPTKCSTTTLLITVDVSSVSCRPSNVAVMVVAEVAAAVAVLAILAVVEVVAILAVAVAVAEEVAVLAVGAAVAVAAESVIIVVGTAVAQWPWRWLLVIVKSHYVVIVL